MSRPRHYSPAISRFLVSVLYHEAKRRRLPMTKLTDELLHKALRCTPGWRTATHLEIVGTATEAPSSEPAEAA